MSNKEKWYWLVEKSYFPMKWPFFEAIKNKSGLRGQEGKKKKRVMSWQKEKL